MKFIKKTIALALCLLLVCTFLACGSQSEEQLEKVAMPVSWTYNYKDVQELTTNSDLIAYVSITAMESYAENGVIMTKYQAEVLDEIYGEKARTVEIIMTGGIVDQTIHEVEDDPLMDAKEAFLIFARKNESGTYTILSGPQGRFVVTDNKVYSLNVANDQVARANQFSNISVNGVDFGLFVSEIQSYLRANK